MIKSAREWYITFPAARKIQEELSGQVITEDRFGNIELVAGIDAAYHKASGKIKAGISVLRLPELKITEEVTEIRDINFPYVPGYLSFREIPAITATFAKLSVKPDLLLFDGQGTAHPRRFGIASHAGVILGIPSIGVAKSRLTGTFETPGNEKGDYTYLYDKEEIIGAVLRTRKNTKPLFISPGHLVGLESSVKYVLACTTRYRLPETTRAAHRLAAFTV